MFSLLLRPVLATLAACAGGAGGAWFGRSGSRRLPLLIFTALGVLLAVTLCEILPGAKSPLSWPSFLASSLSGFLALWMISRFIYRICPSCAFGDLNSATAAKLGETAVLFIVALAIHNLFDGVALVVGDQIKGRPDLALFSAISFHKVAEGIALVLVLIAAGYTAPNALLVTCGIEFTTVLGGIAGLQFLPNASPGLLALLFAHIGGGFLYLIGSTFNSLPDRKSLAAGAVSFSCTVIALWVGAR